MLGTVILLLCIGLWLLVLVPTVSAETVCRKNLRGQIVCREQRRPVTTRIGIAVGIIICVVAAMVICLILFVKRNRAEAEAQRAATAASPTYRMEESQVQGPSEMREAQYTPESGPIGVYDERSSQSAGGEPTFPRPEPAVFPSRGGYYRSPQTAPTTKVRFAEESLDEENSQRKMASTLAVPRTAYVSSGFPRPLYTSLPKHQRPQ